jgi:hemin uptake protein HemP
MGPLSVVSMSEKVQTHTPDDEPAATPQRREIHTWSSEQLLGEACEARIVHGSEVYRLLRTRNDKLILVK